MDVRNDEGADSKNCSECKVNIPVAAAVMPTGSVCRHRPFPTAEIPQGSGWGTQKVQHSEG